MEQAQDKTSAEREGAPPQPPDAESPKVVVENGTQQTEETKTSEKAESKKVAKGKCSKKHTKSKRKKSKKHDSSSDSSSDSDSDDDKGDNKKYTSPSSSSDSEDSTSDEEDAKKKRITKKRQEPHKSKKKTRAKKLKKGSKQSSDSDSDSDSSDSDVAAPDAGADQRTQADLLKQIQLLQLQLQQQSTGGSFSQSNDVYQYSNPAYQQPPPGMPGSNHAFQSIINNNAQIHRSRPYRGGPPPPVARGLFHGGALDSSLLDKQQQQQQLLKDGKKKLKATKMDYKRVDQVWDNTIHNYKLQDTAEGTIDAQYDDFLFHVRRTFDWEGKYKATIVDIKSKFLRECLQDVMGNIKGVSLVEETPKLDPNMLFL